MGPVIELAEGAVLAGERDPDWTVRALYGSCSLRCSPTSRVSHCVIDEHLVYYHESQKTKPPERG
jgi:hypothetical protein